MTIRAFWTLFLKSLGIWLVLSGLTVITQFLSFFSFIRQPWYPKHIEGFVLPKSCIQADKVAAGLKAKGQAYIAGTSQGVK